MGRGGALPLELWVSVQGSRGNMLGGSMMDLTMGEVSDGDTARLLETGALLDDMWPMDEGGDCESQKRSAGGDHGDDNGRSTSYSEVGTGRSKQWLGGPRAGLRDLGAVPAST